MKPAGLRWSILCLLWLTTAACGGPTGQDARSGDGRETTEKTRVAAEETASVTTREGERADVENDQALISASRRGDAEAVERLLAQGASLEARDGNGATALVAAAYGNHLAVVESLIEAGADVNAKDRTEQSSYLISTSEVGDDPRLLELTLRNGANVQSLDSYDGTGLIRASERGHVEMVGELLETDISVDHVNNLGWTALLEAIILGDCGPRHTGVVRLLVEAGADVNLADGEGVTPLQHARERGCGEISRILLRNGAR